MSAGIQVTDVVAETVMVKHPIYMIKAAHVYVTVHTALGPSYAYVRGRTNR